MRRIQRFHALSVFGDMKPHRYGDAVAIGALHFANPANRSEIWPGQKIAKNMYYTDVFENIVKQLLNNGLLMLVENDYVRKLKLQNCSHKTHPDPSGVCIGWQVSPRDYDIQITKKGRACLGMEQIERSGDYGFYKNFDGSIDSAKKIDPGKFGNGFKNN